MLFRSSRSVIPRFPSHGGGAHDPLVHRGTCAQSIADTGKLLVVPGNRGRIGTNRTRTFLRYSIGDRRPAVFYVVADRQAPHVHPKLCGIRHISSAIMLNVCMQNTHRTHLLRLPSSVLAFLESRPTNMEDKTPLGFCRIHFLPMISNHFQFCHSLNKVSEFTPCNTSRNRY